MGMPGAPNAMGMPGASQNQPEYISTDLENIDELFDKKPVSIKDRCKNTEISQLILECENGNDYYPILAYTLEVLFSSCRPLCE